LSDSNITYCYLLVSFAITAIMLGLLTFISARRFIYKRIFISFRHSMLNIFLTVTLTILIAKQKHIYLIKSNIYLFGWRWHFLFGFFARFFKAFHFTNMPLVCKLGHDSAEVLVHVKWYRVSTRHNCAPFSKSAIVNNGVVTGGEQRQVVLRRFRGDHYIFQFLG